MPTSHVRLRMGGNCLSAWGIVLMSEGSDETSVPPELQAAWSNGVPLDVSACHARWWQPETWLRDLLHLELRARDGRDWAGSLEPRVEKRRSRDSARTYMSSPDASAVLTFSDTGDLLSIIDEEWDLVAPSLLPRVRWDGRVDEIRDIRNRVAHCRRPHPQDLQRLELLLGDLTSGAYAAAAMLNLHHAADKQRDDRLVDLWVRREHETARRLIDHAERQYDISFQLSASRRPWARAIPDTAAISGTPGWLWHAKFYLSGRRLRSARHLWNDLTLDGAVDDLTVLVISTSPHDFEVIFAAVDDADAIGDAIGRIFDAIAIESRPNTAESLEQAREANAEWAEELLRLDWRVRGFDIWSITDDMLPIDVFGTGTAVTSRIPFRHALDWETFETNTRHHGQATR